MKILIIPVVTPYPLDNGGAVAQYAVLEYLQDKCDITVCCKAYSTLDVSNIELLRKKLPRVCFKIIDLEDKANLIESKVTKRSVKKKIIGVLKRIYHKFDSRKKTTDFPINNSDEKVDEFKDAYRINPVVLKSEAYINQLTEIIQSDSWDIIQTEFYEMLELVNLFPTNSRKVFVSHESRTLRLESASTVTNSSNEFCNYIISLNKLYETELLKKYDSIIVFSKDDKQRLNGFGVSKIEVSAFPVLASDFIEVSPFKMLKQLVFIGGASHYPNREGFYWFVENIYPAIYEKYKLPLIVIGSWSDNFRIKSEVGEIIYKGFVETLTDEIKDSVQIVPVRIGNGIRTKILLGMAMKMPIITTALGVEGIEVKDNKEIFIADTINDYLEKIEYIIHNQVGTQNLLENASNFVLKNYSQKEVGETRLKIYKNLLTIN